MSDKTEQTKNMLAFLCEMFHEYVSVRGGSRSEVWPFYYGFVAGLICTATDGGNSGN